MILGAADRFAFFFVIVVFDAPLFVPGVLIAAVSAARDFVARVLDRALIALAICRFSSIEVPHQVWHQANAAPLRSCANRIAPVGCFGLSGLKRPRTSEPRPAAASASPILRKADELSL